MNFISIFPASKLHSVAKTLYIPFSSSSPSLLSIYSNIHCQDATDNCYHLSHCFPLNGCSSWRQFTQHNDGDLYKNMTLCILILSLKLLWLIFQRKLNPLNLDFPHQNLALFSLFSQSSNFKQAKVL